MKSFSVATLNLHHFTSWEERFPKIVELFKDTNPDIIFTQETQLDRRFSENNQVDLLNTKLDYPYTLFSVAEVRTHQKGKELSVPVEHGLGILSKYPIKEVEVHKLSQEKEDKEKRIAVTYTVSIEGEDFSITNIHFANKDNLAYLHLQEVIEFTKPQTSIIGDFNIHAFNLEKYRDLYNPQWVSSYDYLKYISFPSEAATFDYALVSRFFSVEDVSCREENVSDHKMLVVTISKNK